MLRWPIDQISGFAPTVSTKGLSWGTEPSGLMRTTLPKWLFTSRACTRPSRIERSPSVTNSLPSGANTSRPPACRVDSSVGCMRKMTCTPSTRGGSPSTSFPRATASPLPPSRGS